MHTSVVDSCCDELLWDFERTLNYKAGAEKTGADASLILENLAVHLKAIHAELTGFDALLGFEDFLNEEIQRHGREGNHTGRMVAENALNGLRDMAETHRTRGVVLLEWQKVKIMEALARKSQLNLGDVLLLFGKETIKDFHAPEYYEIDEKGIHAKTLSEAEKSHFNAFQWQVFEKIKQHHQLDFPCAPSELLEWCNRFDHAGMLWEKLLPKVFVDNVKPGTVEADKTNAEHLVGVPQAQGR